MKMFLLPLAAGLIAGLLTGAGIGGGTLLMLWLTLGAKLPQAQAQGINLLYFLCTAPPALLGHRKRGLIDGKTVKSALRFGIPAAALASLLSAIVRPGLLRQLFGILCLVLGTREVLAKREK